MAVFEVGQGILYVMQMLNITQLVIWFGWLSHVALAQQEISEKLTSSGTLPDLVLTCIANLSIFITCFLGRRLDVDVSARDLVGTGPKLEDINGFGLSTCRGEYQNASVVMLSNRTSNSSMRHFMKYIYNAHNLNSIILQCNRLESAVVTIETCQCNEHGVATSSMSDSKIRCNCIVFWTVEDITIILAHRMPGILKRLSNSLCLLPSLQCLKNGCHGCNEASLLHHVGGQRLTEGNSTVEFPAAVCETLDIFLDFFGTSALLPDCICIPAHPADSDEWTKLLIRSLRYEDPEVRSVDRVVVTASDALQNYMDQKGGCSAIERYKGIPAVFPRLAELVINVVLIGCLRVDGFSSALVARRAVREYLLDTKGTAFSANIFLVQALVKSNADYTQVCQVLTFTSSLLSVQTLSLIVGSVNLFCSITWAVLVASEGAHHQWYDIHSMPLSKRRVAVLMAAINTALVMDCLDWVFLSKRIRDSGRIGDKMRHLFWAATVLEIVYIVLGVAIGATLGIKGFGKWVYGALQGLVWVKWGIGSILIDEFLEEFDSRQQRTKHKIHHQIQPYLYGRGGRYRFESGILVYSSAFFLNAILAGVRANWTYSPS